jgi:gliding motility-associated-like protein
MKKRVTFFFLVIFLSFDICAQQQELHDQKEVQEAERLLPFFDRKFKTNVLEKVTTSEDYASFYQYAMEYIVRDRSLFFGKALHGELKENDIDDYLEKQVLRVYKNVNAEFLNKKNSPLKETILLPESAGDPCNNIDFESGNTTGWEGWTGFATEVAYPPNSSLVPGFQPQQHQIMSGSGVYDAIVGGSLLSTVAPGGNYSLRLENTFTGGNLSRISQTFLVNPANANFTYRYAVVLEDPSSSHTDPQRPFFRIRVLDQSGNEILCGHYEVIAKPPITGFQQVPSTNYYWRDWTSVAIPLAAFVGQNVTVEFTASDCSLGGHLGYAYIDGSCFQSSIVSVPSGNCGGLPYTLIAPPGYASYAWTGPGIVGATNVQTITVNQTGTYTCVITSVSGPTCKTTLKAVVGNNPTINAGPDFYICPGGYAQLNASVSLTNSYTWSPTATLTNPNTLNPIARPTATTTYYLTGCGKIDSATVYVDDVDFAITPDFTTCGTSTVSLSATPTVAGSYTYSWSPSTGMTGANTATPTVTLSGTTTYSVTVTNVTSGCSNTRQVTVTVSTGSSTSAGADKVYCGTAVQLNAVGGTNFTWTDINGNIPVGLSCSNCSNPLASPSVTTSYIVTSNLTAPCINKDTVVVAASNPFTLSLPSTYTICGSGTTSMSVTPSPAGSYTYSWFPSATLTGANSATPVASPAATTNYAVTVTDAIGCFKTAYTLVNVVPAMSIGTAASPSAICTSGTSSILTATLSSATCSNYLLNTITYSPVVGTGTTVALTNNTVSTALPIGFNFSFYCNQYSQFYISDNGFITFSSTSGAGCCAGQAIPAAAIPNNLIALSWGDLNPALGGNINYFTTGSAPNRKLIVNFTNVPHATGVDSCTVQLILSETSHAIEVHVTKIKGSKSNHTLGIENAGGTLALAAPGKNAAPFTSSNEAFLFSTTPDITWFSGATNIGTGTSVTVTPSATAVYSATASFASCTASSEVVVNLTNISAGSDVQICKGDTAGLNAVPNNMPTCSGYTTSNIPYFHQPGVYTPVVMATNSLSAALPIGFNFGFYCNNYSQFYVSSQGFITFSGTSGNGCCTGQLLPNTSAPNNLIAFGWQHYSPGSGSYEYLLTGSAPNRKLTIYFKDSPIETQVSLYETSNIIEIHTLNMITFGGVGSGNATTMGIENLDGTAAVTVAGRNQFIWSASNEGKRFTPVPPLYTWTPSTGLSSTTISNPKAHPTSTTTYTVSASNGFCTMQDMVMVTVLPPPMVYLGKDTSFCLGGTLVLDAGNAGATYKWSTGALSQTIPVSTSGIYWAEVNDGLCKARDSITVSIVNPPVVNLGNDTTLCTGFSTTLNAKNTGSSYLWSTGALSQTIIASSPGYYWVDVNNGKCPVKRDSIYISNINKPIVNIGHDTLLCNGVTLLLNASNAGAGFGWSTGVTTQTISVSTPGIYWVDVNNGVCPKVRDSITVTYKNKPAVNLGRDTTLCTGSSILLNAANLGATYGWSTGVGTQTISVSAPGYYWVDVDNGVCPKVRDSIYISNKNPAVVDLGADTLLCTGNTLLINVGNVGSIYQWSTGASSQTILVSTQGKYIVTVNNGICPLVKDSIVVSYVSKPVVNLGADSTLCVGQQLLLDAQNASSLHQWSTGAVSQTIVASTQGYYWAEVDNGVCPKVRDSIYITILSYPVVNIGPDETKCITDLVTLDAAHAGLSVVWSTGATTHTITPNLSDIYWADVANGRCITRDSATITYVPISTVNFGTDTTVCNGTTILLKALNSGTYTWSTGELTQGIYVSSPGNYWVDIDNGYCALKRHNVTVAYVNPPVVDLGVDSLLVCYNDTVKLDAANTGAAFTWYNKKNNHLASSQQVVFYNNLTGYYWVSVYNGACARRDSVYINFTANPNPLHDTVLCAGNKILFKAGSGFKSYLWQDGSVDSIFVAYVSDLLQDTLRVTIKDFYGCTYLDSMILFAIDCTVEELFIPNLITPNNDLNNDNFHVKGLPKESDLSVYNRWGDRIYHSSDYDNSWGGEGVSDGVYYFTLKLSDGREFKSWVQIIK